MDLHDISAPVHPGMLQWPTGRVAATHVVVDASGPRNSEWMLDAHAGTHVDAPLHWLPDGGAVESIPLAACLGPCTVVAVTAASGLIEPDELPADRLRPGARILLKTPVGAWGRAAFDPAFPGLSVAAARALAGAGVALVGIDELSVETPAGDGSVHRTLLEAGVVLLEGLDLRAVAPGDYQLSALPVALAGSEAAPVRAVLWRP
jgi:arylformamidase